MWRTVSVEQLVAITGNTRLAARFSRDRALLWAAGLVQRGTLVLDGVRQHPGTADRVRLYRPDLHCGSFDRLARRLSYAEWVGVTGGWGWAQGAQFDRHNLLAVELCLRVAEWCDVAAVLGESLATWKTMLDPTAGVPATSRRAADAAWVRPDGLTIAVEMTSHVASHSKEKAQAWADALARDESRSTMVLFVEAAHPDRRESGHNVHLLRRHVAAAANSTMDHVLADVASRMAVVRWVDWFPAPGLVDPSVVSLPVWRPTGPGRSDLGARQPARPVRCAIPGTADPVGAEPPGGARQPRAALRGARLAGEATRAVARQLGSVTGRVPAGQAKLGAHPSAAAATDERPETGRLGHLGLCFSGPRRQLGLEVRFASRLEQDQLVGGRVGHLDPVDDGHAASFPAASSRSMILRAPVTTACAVAFTLSLSPWAHESM